MKKPGLVLLVLSVLALWAGAQEASLPRTGEICDSLTYDLDGDGEIETVALAAYNVDKAEWSYWSRLKVLDSSGELVWGAPLAFRTDHRFAFGLWAFGGAKLDWLGDLEADGIADLISQGPISDVSPPIYRRYRWRGGAFEPDGQMMLLQTPAGAFAWTEPVGWDGEQPLTWVSHVSGGPSQLTADITSFRQGGDLWSGTAVLEWNGNEFAVTSWNVPLGPQS